MKTIWAKTNPAFKRAQLLPVILDLLPPTTGGAARHFSEFTESKTGSRPQKTELTVYPTNVNPGNIRPVTHLLN